VTLAWALTTGEQGMRTQARGLAEAVADDTREVTVARAGALWFPGGSANRLRRLGLAPPWPDILVTCGRRSVALSIAIGRASGGRVFRVHIQDPRTDPAAFDLVLAMGHDRIAASEKVIKLASALHDLTPGKLDAAADAWRARFAALGRPLVGVLVGGDLRGRRFGRADSDALVDGLARLRQETGAAFAITPSRRTPEALRRRLEAAFGGDGRGFVWNLAGPNPYRAILALADRLVATSDSVSMISEALFLPKPVDVLDLGFARHRGFIQDLVDQGRIRRFDGAVAVAPRSDSIDATAEAAALVRARMGAYRTGVSG